MTADSISAAGISSAKFTILNPPTIPHTPTPNLPSYNVPPVSFERCRFSVITNENPFRPGSVSVPQTDEGMRSGLEGRRGAPPLTFGVSASLNVVEARFRSVSGSLFLFLSQTYCLALSLAPSLWTERMPPHKRGGRGLLSGSRSFPVGPVRSARPSQSRSRRVNATRPLL